MGQSDRLCLSLLRSSLSGVVESYLSTRVSLVVVTLCLPQKDWYADLLTLLVTEPLKLPMPWNLLIHPDRQMFHRGLEALQLDAWRLTSNSSERLTFCGELRRLSLWTTRVPQQLSIRGSGLGSFFDVVDGISPCKATIQEIASSSFISSRSSSYRCLWFRAIELP